MDQSPEQDNVGGEVGVWLVCIQQAFVNEVSCEYLDHADREREPGRDLRDRKGFGDAKVGDLCGFETQVGSIRLKHVVRFEHRLETEPSGTSDGAAPGDHEGPNRVIVEVCVDVAALVIGSGRRIDSAEERARNRISVG
jgi:hypothetical protein